MSLTRITSDLIKDGTVGVEDLASATKTAISGSSASGSVSTRTTALETASGSFSTRITNATASINSISSSQATRTANLVIASSSLSSSVATLKGSGTLQSVATNASPTFAGATITGTLTAQEVHTEFESASIIFSSGSTIFGDTADDIHQMTGSLRVITNAETNVVKFFNDGGDQNRDVMILQGGADAGPGNTRFITFKDGDGSDFGFIQGPANGATAGISFNTTADTALLTLSGSQVGIGTINPQTGRLHIHNGDSGATSYVQLTQDGTGTSGTNGLLVGVNAAEASIIYNGEDTPLIFYTNASERVRIDNSGKVGIGSTSPAGLIDVMGDSGYAYFTTTSPAAFNMIFRSGSADPQNNWLGQIEFTGASSGTSQIVTRNNNALALGVNNSHKLTLETNNDITVESGDIVFGSSGRGIVLGNTSNADANTLDDYEEGVWTPVPYYQNSGDQTVAENNDSNALGRYVIVGRQITLWAAVTYDMSSLGGITFDNIGIKNLPVSTANITNYRAVGCFQYSGNNASDEDTTFTISMGPNNNSMHISHQDGTGNQAQSFGNGSSISLFGTITFLLP